LFFKNSSRSIISKGSTVPWKSLVLSDSPAGLTKEKMKEKHQVEVEWSSVV